MLEIGFAGGGGVSAMDGAFGVWERGRGKGNGRFVAQDVGEPVVFYCRWRGLVGW